MIAANITLEVRINEQGLGDVFVSFHYLNENHTFTNNIFIDENNSLDIADLTGKLYRMASNQNA